MSCREIETRLGELLDGTLDADVRRRLEAHMESCDRCRDLEAAVRGSLAALPGTDDADLTGEVLRRTVGSACGRAHGLLPGLVDGMLDAAEAELVRGHLAHCAPCASLAAALEEAADLLPAMAEVDPGRAFTGVVLWRTTGRRAGMLPGRLWRWWQSLLQRPRVAWEGAYVGAFVLMLLFGTPVSPLRHVPAQALELVRTNPMRVIEAGIAPLPAFGERIAGYSERAWQATGGKVLDRTRPARAVLAQRAAAAWSVTGSLKRHTAQGWAAFLEGDFEATGVRLRKMGQDLKTMWMRLTTAVPEAAGEEPEAQEV